MAQRPGTRSWLCSPREELILGTRPDRLSRKLQPCVEVDPRAFTRISVKAMRAACQHLPAQEDIAVCRLRQVRMKVDFNELCNQEMKETFSNRLMWKVKMHPEQQDQQTRKQLERNVHLNQELMLIELES